MSENNQDPLDDDEANKLPKDPPKDPPADPPKKPEDEEFSHLKANLDRAYGERDSLKDEVAALKAEKRDAEIQRLKDEGKEREAFEAQISDLNATITQLNHRIVELTRDNDVRQVLSTHSFRNERAVELAYESIIKELVQDEKGTWVHRSGKAVKDFIQTFSEDEENKFLFKEKENRGTGNTPNSQPKVPAESPKTGKLTGMSQKDVLAMARKGQLPNQRR